MQNFDLNFQATSTELNFMKPSLATNQVKEKKITFSEEKHKFSAFPGFPDAQQLSSTFVPESFLVTFEIAEMGLSYLEDVVIGAPDQTLVGLDFVAVVEDFPRNCSSQD